MGKLVLLDRWGCLEIKKCIYHLNRKIKAFECSSQEDGARMSQIQNLKKTRKMTNLQTSHT
jgi:hypothetical protein